MSLRRPPLTVISGIGLPSGPSAGLAGAGLAARGAAAGRAVSGLLSDGWSCAAGAVGSMAGALACAARGAIAVGADGVVWAGAWRAVAPSRARQAKGISLLMASKKVAGRARAAARLGDAGATAFYPRAWQRRRDGAVFYFTIHKRQARRRAKTRMFTAAAPVGPLQRRAAYRPGMVTLPPLLPGAPPAPAAPPAPPPRWWPPLLAGASSLSRAAGRLPLSATRIICSLRNCTTC